MQLCNAINFPRLMHFHEFETIFNVKHTSKNPYNGVLAPIGTLFSFSIVEVAFCLVAICLPALTPLFPLP